jgi:hypothetical protein
MKMATTAAPKNPIADWEKLRDDWLKRLQALMSDVQVWAQEFGWATRRIEKRMEDLQIGAYVAPALLMQEGTTRVMLEPITRFAPGVDGVVDLYQMPAYDDIASMSLTNGTWRIHSWPKEPQANGDLHEVDPVPLSKENLRTLLDGMGKNAS